MIINKVKRKEELAAFWPINRFRFRAICTFIYTSVSITKYSSEKFDLWPNDHISSFSSLSFKLNSSNRNLLKRNLETLIFIKVKRKEELAVVFFVRILSWTDYGESLPREVSRAIGATSQGENWSFPRWWVFGEEPAGFPGKVRLMMRKWKSREVVFKDLWRRRRHCYDF